MWKLMIFGIVVQLVLLVSILDVNVFDDGRAVRNTELKSCIRNLMVISIEGLEHNDIMIALNRSEAVRDLIQITATYNVNVSLPNYESNYTNNTNYTTADQTAGSVFDGKQLLYVGPPTSPYEFNTSLWDFILINQENNYDKNYGHNMKNSTDNGTNLLNAQLIYRISNYGSYMLNQRIVIDHMRRIIENQRLDFYPIKLINIGRVSSSDRLMSEEERVWYFTKVYETIRNASRSSNYIFVITSSMSLLVRNYTEDHSNDTLLVLGHPECISKQPTPPIFNSTIDYDEAYSKLEGYAFLTSCRREVPKDSQVAFFMVEGNILEFIGGRAFEMQKMYMSFGLYFTGWETLNAVLNSLENIEIETNLLVIAATVFIFFMWISFLSIKTVKLAVDSSQNVEVNSTLLKLLNALCLVLIVVLCVAAKVSGSPCRYLIYISIAILVFRLFCGELLASARIQMECSLMDKVKIALQLFILIAVVESLFWSILFGRILFIVFVLAAFGRILQGALSVLRFRTIIAFSLATLLIGLQYLWPFASFGKLINLNLSASLWTVASIAAIKFLMDKSNHDRFVMFICVLELLMAMSFANIFIIYGFSFFSVVPVVGFFMGLSLILPLFGGADPKNRLLELATATAAVFVFFSCNGESFFLLSSFIASFCSYMMDRATIKKVAEDDSYYINIFPATFHAVLLILACNIVTPAGGEAIMRAYTLLNIDSQYQVVASGIFYFMKLGFLVNLLEATFLSSGQKLLAVPNLFIVVIILNLISFRAFIQYSMFSAEGGRKLVFINHILMHVVAAMSFYLYSFVQVLCNTNFFSICKTSEATYIPQEAVH